MTDCVHKELTKELFNHVRQEMIQLIHEKNDEIAYEERDVLVQLVHCISDVAVAENLEDLTEAQKDLRGALVHFMKHCIKESLHNSKL